ncbi:hypothetical protein ACQF36_16290 [Streptomyces sp. Marseille-Q5077]|uniref:hypothetical protein n=1 Tax=Streptomyces sp. Marseille-Q5077 TaxID=3418995 RepID=UPI003D02FC2A
MRPATASPHRRIAASPHRRIAASPHRRIAASPHRRIAASPHRRIADQDAVAESADSTRSEIHHRGTPLFHTGGSHFSC